MARLKVFRPAEAGVGLSGQIANFILHRTAAHLTADIGAVYGWFLPNGFAPFLSFRRSQGWFSTRNSKAVCAVYLASHSTVEHF
jgi:hypothetical protein